MGEVLASLFKIEYRSIEIVIVDNGSSDDTFEYLHKTANDKAPGNIQIKFINLFDFDSGVARGGIGVYEDSKFRFIFLKPRIGGFAQFTDLRRVGDTYVGVLGKPFLVPYMALWDMARGFGYVLRRLPWLLRS
nr:glycosyltransferase family A protein [Pyrobaculum ferrireducens]